MTPNVVTTPKQQVACDYVTGNFSISQFPAIEINDTEIVQAVDNLNQAIGESCKLQSAEAHAKVAEAVESLNLTISSSINSEKLILALDKLNNTLSTTPTGSFKEVLGGAIFSVIAAFVFNFLYWKVKEKKERLRAAINEAKDALLDFEENAVEYWSHDYNPKDAKTNTVQEAKIKANHSLLLSTYTNRIFPLLTSVQVKNENANLKKSIQSEIENLFDIATGGDFESSSRKASKKNVADIIRRCTRIRTRLANIGS